MFMFSTWFCVIFYKIDSILVGFLRDIVGAHTSISISNMSCRKLYFRIIAQHPDNCKNTKQNSKLIDTEFSWLFHTYLTILISCWIIYFHIYIHNTIKYKTTNTIQYNRTSVGSQYLGFVYLYRFIDVEWTAHWVVVLAANQGDRWAFYLWLFVFESGLLF